MNKEWIKTVCLWKKHTISVLNFTDKMMDEIDKIPAEEIEYYTKIFKKTKDFKQEQYQETLKRFKDTEHKHKVLNVAMRQTDVKVMLLLRGKVQFGKLLTAHIDLVILEIELRENAQLNDSEKKWEFEDWYHI